MQSVHNTVNSSIPPAARRFCVKRVSFQIPESDPSEQKVSDIKGSQAPLIPTRCFLAEQIVYRPPRDLLTIPSTALVALRDSFEFVSDTDCEKWDLPATQRFFRVTEEKGLSRSQHFSALDIYSRPSDPLFQKAVVHFNLSLLSAPSLTSEDTPWQAPGVPFRLHKSHGPRVRPRKFVGAQEFRKEKRLQRKRPRHHDSSQELKRSK